MRVEGPDGLEIEFYHRDWEKALERSHGLPKVPSKQGPKPESLIRQDQNLSFCP